MPSVIQELHKAQISKFQELQRDFPDEKKNSVRLINKLLHNTDEVDGEFIRNHLPELLIVFGIKFDLV